MCTVCTQCVKKSTSNQQSTEVGLRITKHVFGGTYYIYIFLFMKEAFFTYRKNKNVFK